MRPSRKALCGTQVSTASLLCDLLLLSLQLHVMLLKHVMKISQDFSKGCLVELQYIGRMVMTPVTFKNLKNE